MTTQDNDKTWTDTLPFPKRWLGYVTIKILMLAAVIYVALRWKGVL